VTRIERSISIVWNARGSSRPASFLEVSETATRRQTLADQSSPRPNDVLVWRDEALMLNWRASGPMTTSS